MLMAFHCLPYQIPEPEVAIHSVHVDPDGAYLAAVNSKVRPIVIAMFFVCFSCVSHGSVPCVCVHVCVCVRVCVIDFGWFSRLEWERSSFCSFLAFLFMWGGHRMCFSCTVVALVEISPLIVFLGSCPMSMCCEQTQQ